MGSRVAHDIVFDIIDELTDNYHFSEWWNLELDRNERQLIQGNLVGIIDNNLEREASLIAKANSELSMLAEAENGENDV